MMANPLKSLIGGNMGGVMGGSNSIYTIATANDYGNVSATRLVRVPCNANANITLGNNSLLTLLVEDANIVIKRLA